MTTEQQTHEEIFHEALYNSSMRAESWYLPLEAARACLNLGFATVEQIKKQHDLEDCVKLLYNCFLETNEIADLTYEQAWDFTISYCSKPFKDSEEIFWALFAIEDKCWHGYPGRREYVISQPFEVLVDYIAYLKENHELEYHLEENEFETLTHFKHYTPEWDERFKALVPGWEPYNPED